MQCMALGHPVPDKRALSSADLERLGGHGVTDHHANHVDDFGQVCDLALLVLRVAKRDGERRLDPSRKCLDRVNRSGAVVMATGGAATEQQLYPTSLAGRLVQRLVLKNMSHLDGLGVELLPAVEPRRKASVALHLQAHKATRSAAPALEDRHKGPGRGTLPTAVTTSCRNLNGGFLSSFSDRVGLSTMRFSPCRIATVVCQDTSPPSSAIVLQQAGGLSS